MCEDYFENVTTYSEAKVGDDKDSMVGEQH